MWIRRACVVLSAIGLLLAPGVGGLSALLDPDEVCACGMGPDCPMCAARRNQPPAGADHAECRCRLTVPGDRQGARHIPSLQPQPACIASTTLPSVRPARLAPPESIGAPASPAPEPPRRPPRAVA